jgi:uncharacterized protein YndB with AHSA1/START domain
VKQIFKEDISMPEDLIINRHITKEVTLPVGIDDAWNTWTTKQGLESFFAPECHVELELFGRFEIFFLPDAQPGSRGAENNKILAVEPKRMFCFTWDAPATMPEVRKQRTSVVLKFENLGESKTRISMCHTGWGDGDEWDSAFDYFVDAWDVVLRRLEIRFEQGPIDWEKQDFPRK